MDRMVPFKHFYMVGPLRLKDSSLLSYVILLLSNKQSSLAKNEETVTRRKSCA